MRPSELNTIEPGSAAARGLGPAGSESISKLSVGSRRSISLTLAVTSFVAVGVLWEFIGRTVNNSIFFVPLSAIGDAAIEMARTGELWTHFSASLIECSIGFVIACTVGVLIGCFMSLHWLVRDLLEPWVAALYTVPIIAIGSLFIIWLGIGLTSKIVIVFLVAVFPVILSTVVGLNQVEPHLVEAVRSFGATSLDIYTKVRLPAAIPSILTGFRIALRGALVAVVVAELFGSKAGLGQMILSYSQSFETAKVFVGVLSLSGLGIVGFMLLRLIERFLTPWQQQRTGT